MKIKKNEISYNYSYSSSSNSYNQNTVNINYGTITNSEDSSIQTIKNYIGQLFPKSKKEKKIKLNLEGTNADILVKDWNRDGKPEANVKKLSSKIKKTFPDIVDTWKSFGLKKPVITSGNDGRHKHGSKHYINNAIDLRANNIPNSLAREVAKDLQFRLGKDYDVIFEAYPENPANDHIHVEYDPK